MSLIEFSIDVCALRAKGVGEDLIATLYIGRQLSDNSRFYWPRDKVTLCTLDSSLSKLSILNL